MARGGGLPDPNRQKVIDELLPLTKKSGDATAGKLIFKNNCAKCHTHSGEGAKIGPDLTGMAVHPKDHLLVEIMDPSRSVEGNYRQYQVTTKAGRILTGLLASENKTAIEMIDAEGEKTHAAARGHRGAASLAQVADAGRLRETAQSRARFTNLLEFLTQRGKYLPLAAGQGGHGGQHARHVFQRREPGGAAGVPGLVAEDVPGRAVQPGRSAGRPGAERGPAVRPGAARPRRRCRSSVSVPCNAPAKAIHLLSGVSGWGYPLGEKGSVTMIVRLHYADGKTEDHALKNGEHFADYIRRVDVPESVFAFALRGQQLRYLAVHPKRMEKIAKIEFERTDRTAPLVVAVTIEGAE